MVHVKSKILTCLRAISYTYICVIICSFIKNSSSVVLVEKGLGRPKPVDD